MKPSPLQILGLFLILGAGLLSLSVMTLGAPLPSESLDVDGDGKADIMFFGQVVAVGETLTETQYQPYSFFEGGVTEVEYIAIKVGWSVTGKDFDANTINVAGTILVGQAQTITGEYAVIDSFDFTSTSSDDYVQQIFYFELDSINLGSPYPAGAQGYNIAFSIDMSLDISRTDGTPYDTFVYDRVITMGLEWVTEDNNPPTAEEQIEAAENPPVNPHIEVTTIDRLDDERTQVFSATDQVDGTLLNPALILAIMGICLQLFQIYESKRGA